MRKLVRAPNADPRPLLKRGLAVLAMLTVTSSASAQPQMSRVPVRRASPEQESGEQDRGVQDRVGGMPLRGSVGVPAAERLIASGDPEARLRGIERLGAIGTAEAIDALIEALEQGSAAGRDPRARLTAVRALAPHAKRDNVRQLLTRELTDPARGPARAASPLGGILRGTAALALAKGSEKRGMAALANAIVQGGPAGAAAAIALRAYPPSSLQLIMGTKKRPHPAIVAFLGELGDLRAIPRLRPLLEGDNKAAQLPAALALAKLGDEAALVRARAWLRKPDPRLLRTAAEVLVYLGAPEAPDALAALLKSDSTRLGGLRLAERLPSPRLAPRLAAAIPLLPEAERPRAVAAIGRAGGAEAVIALRKLVVSKDGAQAPPAEGPEPLGDGKLATAAAFALATMPGDAARAALEALLSANAGAHARLVLRAAITRALVLDDPPDGLDARVRALLSSKDAADRAVGAFGAAALGLGEGEEIVRRCAKPTAPCDAPALHAAARGALARGGDALSPVLVELLVSARGLAGEDQRMDPPGHTPALTGTSTVAAASVTVAAGVALLRDASSISTSTLAAWAEAGGPLAPLAARALGGRDDPAVRGRIKRLLEGSDPVVRAHVALGLGHDPEADSVSLLASAYRFEEDASVRRAIVRGLSGRREAQRMRTLALARDLDPDSGVRALARAALAGRILDPGGPGRRDRGVAWIRIVPNDAAAAASASARAARVVRVDGLAIPVVADPDGVLLVPGMPPGPSTVLLAPTPPPGDAERR